MKNFCLIIVTIFLSAVNNFSQSNTNNAPVKWENYKISNDKLKIMFPKLPVKLEYENQCIQTLVRTYYAYADEVVYKFTIYSKIKESPPAYCREQVKFDQSSFTKHLAEFQTNDSFANVQNIEHGEQTFVRVENKSNELKQIVWLLDDYKNRRYFEFTVSTYKDKKFEENQFVDSVSFGEKLAGIEIKDGSAVTLGDDLPNNGISNNPADEKNKNPLIILVKPKPSYTDQARRNNTTGEVRMRVTFLPNGAISSVSPVTNLENGLTDKAIEAARKIVFLPQKYGDKKIAVTKVVVYSFKIY